MMVTITDLNLAPHRDGTIFLAKSIGLWERHPNGYEIVRRSRLARGLIAPILRAPRQPGPRPADE